MKVRAYSLRMDGMEDTGEFTGYASIFGNVDWYGTVVDKGAFKKTINDNGGKFPLLFFHDPTRPIGMVTAEEDNRGLKVRGRIDLDIPDGRLVYRGLKGGYIDRMSIGFDVITEAVEGEIPHYKEVRLWETSLITRNFAANEEALVSDVRSVAIGVQRVRQALLAGAEKDLRAAISDLREVMATLEVRGATTFSDLPLASRDRKWDAAAAVKRVRAWAGAEDAPNAKYRKAFFWYDAESADNFTAYKFPFADVIDGTLTAVPHAIFNAAARIDGSSIPAGDKDKVKRHIEKYYAKMKREFDDDTIVAPWNRAVQLPDELIGMMREIKELLREPHSTRRADEPLEHSSLLEELRKLGQTLKAG